MQTSDTVIKGDLLVNKVTGEVLGDVNPKFQGYDYKRYRAEFCEEGQPKFLEPMTAQELSDEKLQQYLDETIVLGEQKFDGHRGLLHLTPKGNRMFSRRVSKKTDWYAENSDQVPHIRDINVPQELYGTVIDGEIVLPIENCTCRQVQSVTGALPETAIANQMRGGLAFLNAFDILYYKGINVQSMPLWKRKVYLYKVVKALDSDYIRMCKMYMDKGTMDYLVSKWGEYEEDDRICNYTRVVGDLEEQYADFLKEGKEGLIIKDVDGIYEQKRSKAFIKLKSRKTYDVVIMGYENPTVEVDLNERKTKVEDWLYWESYEQDIYTDGLPKGQNIDECCPVTKFYAMGWIGAVKFGVWKRFDWEQLVDMYGEGIDVMLDNGELIDSDEYGARMLVEVGQTSGMDEEVRQLISNNKFTYLGKVIEVMAQGIINEDTGSLQHPRFISFREDKSSDMCTFESHIREDK